MAFHRNISSVKQLVLNHINFRETSMEYTDQSIISNIFLENAILGPIWICLSQFDAAEFCNIVGNMKLVTGLWIKTKQNNNNKKNTKKTKHPKTNKHTNKQTNKQAINDNCEIEYNLYFETYCFLLKGTCMKIISVQGMQFLYFPVTFQSSMTSTMLQSMIHAIDFSSF